jgi:hypothetical protein
MPDEDYQRPEGFDLDGAWDQDSDPEIETLASQFGWDSWRDVIAPDGDFDETTVRPGSYHTIEDAILEAYNVGILDFTTFLYDPLDDEWHMVVSEASG